MARWRPRAKWTATTALSPPCTARKCSRNGEPTPRQRWQPPHQLHANPAMKRQMQTSAPAAAPLLSTWLPSLAL